MQLEYDLRATAVVKNCSRENSGPSAPAHFRVGTEPARLTPRSRIRTWGGYELGGKSDAGGGRRRSCAPRTAGGGCLHTNPFLPLFRFAEKTASAGISTGHGPLSAY